MSLPLSHGILLFSYKLCGPSSNSHHLDYVLEEFQQQVVDKHFTTDVVPPPHILQDANDPNLPAHDVANLKNTIRTLSANSKSKPLNRDTLVSSIAQISSLRLEHLTTPSNALTTHISDLVCLATTKAAVRTLELVLHILLEQTLTVNDEIRYWNAILGSTWYAGLYTVQTCPVGAWYRTKQIYMNWRDSGARLGASSIPSCWERFYNIIENMSYPRAISSLRKRAWLPSRFLGPQVRQNRRFLGTMKDVHSCSIGILMEVLLSLKPDTDTLYKDAYDPSSEKWRLAISKSTVLVEIILQNKDMREASIPEFENAIFATVKGKLDSACNPFDTSPNGGYTFVLDQLACILQESLPNYRALSTDVIGKHGRPSRLVRYWLLFSLTVFSGSTSLRLLASKRNEIIQWIIDIATTAVDFWGNWVVEPVRKLIRTIRHDDNSEIAIMSKNSLEADRSSLERMVLDFIVSQPKSGGDEFTQPDVEGITNKIKEGDLTPVLRSYEKDLQAPLVGTIRGNLVRALLIQIQKTKVDIEIAMSGIDALLKSQELVFGYEHSAVVSPLCTQVDMF